MEQRRADQRDCLSPARSSIVRESFWKHSIKKWSDTTSPFILNDNIICFMDNGHWTKTDIACIFTFWGCREWEAFKTLQSWSYCDYTRARWKMLLRWFVKVVARIPRPLPNQTKLKFDQDVEVCWNFCFSFWTLLVEKKNQKPVDSVWKSVFVRKFRTSSKSHVFPNIEIVWWWKFEQSLLIELKN